MALRRIKAGSVVLSTKWVHSWEHRQAVSLLGCVCCPGGLPQILPGGVLKGRAWVHPRIRIWGMEPGIWRIGYTFNKHVT